MIIQVTFCRPHSQGGMARSSTTAWHCRQERDSPVWVRDLPGGGSQRENLVLHPVLLLSSQWCCASISEARMSMFTALIPLLRVCLSAVIQEQHCRKHASPLWVKCCQTQPEDLPLPHRPSAKVQPANRLSKHPLAGWLSLVVWEISVMITLLQD